MRIRYSVIVPVYNAEKTLKRCLDSLLYEKRKDIELIVVNDGSTDASGQICEDYKEKYSCICYVPQENAGVSAARNRGISLAVGKYIIFVDSDDYVGKSLFSKLDSFCSEYVYDYIFFSNIKKNKEKEILRIFDEFESRNRSSSINYIIKSICHKTINQPWGKLYRTDIIKNNNILFPLGVSVAEDRAFNIKYSLYVNSIRVLSEPLYYVCIENDNSLSRKHHTDLNQQFAIAGEYIMDAIEGASIAADEKRLYQQALNFGECRSIYKNAKDLHNYHIPWFQRIRKINGMCNQINSLHMEYPNTRYCRLVTFPIRWRLSLVIDVMAWKLTH